MILRILGTTTTTWRGGPLPVYIQSLKPVLFEKVKGRRYECLAAGYVADHVRPSRAGQSLVTEFPSTNAEPRLHATLFEISKLMVYDVIIWVLWAYSERCRIDGSEG